MENRQELKSSHLHEHLNDDDSELPRKKFEPDFTRHYFERSAWEDIEALEQFGIPCPSHGEMRNLGEKLADLEDETKGRPICPHTENVSMLENLKLSCSTSPKNSYMHQALKFSHDIQSHFHQVDHKSEFEEETPTTTREEEVQVPVVRTPSPIFSQPVNSFPFLESLSFEHKSTELIVRALKLLVLAGGGDSQVLNHLKCLEISHADMTEDFISFALKHRWNLERLKIGFAPKVPLVSIRTFFTHLRTSLLSLSLHYTDEGQDGKFGTRSESSALPAPPPVGDNWLIPLCMKYLRDVEIEVSSESPPTLGECRFLVNALQLSSLKSLTFSTRHGISWERTEFDRMWNEEDRQRCPWKKNEGTLQVFIVPTGPLLDSSVFLQEPNPWRALKELSCHSPSLPVLHAFFSGLKTLERLVIFGLYGTDGYTWDDILTTTEGIKGRALIWDEILTGKIRPMDPIEYRRNGGVGDEEPLEMIKGNETVHFPSIRNLNKLKFLSLDFEQSLMYNEEPTDFLIYHGLVCLPQLEHVHINRHAFTADAVRDLRRKIHPFANLEFGLTSYEDLQCGFDGTYFPRDEN